MEAPVAQAGDPIGDGSLYRSKPNFDRLPRNAVYSTGGSGLCISDVSELVGFGCVCEGGSLAGKLSKSSLSKDVSWGGDLSASFDLIFSLGLAFFFMERSDQSAKLYGSRNVPS
jgi:hypothetical protein